MRPANVDALVASKIGINTSVGLIAPCSARYKNTAMGNNVTDEVFNTKNKICAFDKVSLLGESDCISCIALIPNGVAALSKPSMFAEIFMVILPKAGWSLGISGMIRVNKGDNTLDNLATNPDCSAT